MFETQVVFPLCKCGCADIMHVASTGRCVYCRKCEQYHHYRTPELPRVIEEFKLLDTDD